MTNEQFIQKFGHFIDAPNGLQKLRELILQLAVQGKLVSQELCDEPASVLLKKVIDEKKRLIKNKVIRQTKTPVLPGEGPPHDLPDTWVWTYLYEIGEIGPRNDDSDEVDASFVPMQLISDNYGTPVQHEVRPWKEIKSGFTHFREEDVVLAKITPCFQNGKSAVMRDLTNGFGAGTTELHVYRAIKPCTVPEYVLIYLKSPGFILGGIPKMTGTAGQKRITRDYFAGNHFPLPPLTEQHRIVAKVDELMTLCEQLEAERKAREETHQRLIRAVHHPLTEAGNPAATKTAWRRIRDNFSNLYTTHESVHALRQTILQLAVQGRLVRHDPKEESASALLKRIAKEKQKLVRDRKIKKPKLLSPVSPREVMFPTPDGWVVTRFSEFATEIATGPFGSMVHKSDYVDGGVPLINPSHMVDGKIVPDLSIAVSEEKARELASYKLYPNDIVMARRGEMGRCAVVPQDSNGWLCGTGSFVIRFHGDVARRFIQMLFWSDSVRLYLSGNSVGTTMTNLNHGILNKMPVAVPPVGEQHRIVVKVDELMTLCDQLEVNIRDKSETAERYAEAIVQQIAAA